MPLEMNDSNFSEIISTSDVPVAIDFWAEWCGPCRMLAPVFERVSEKFEGKAAFYKLDIDKNYGASAHFSITSIPTVLIFKNGQEVYRKVGLQAEKMIEDKINELL